MISKAVQVGILVVVGVGLFALGLFFIGSSQQLFSHHYTIYTEFSDIATIQSGATVRVSGMDAGTVANIAIPSTPSGKFRLKLNVDDKFKTLIREDSVASIETEGMVGNQFVQIKKGTDDSPECKPQCTINAKEVATISQLMQQGNQIADQIKSTITDLHGRADVVMGNISDLTGHADQTIKTVAPDVQKIAAHGANISSNVDAVVAGVRQGQGAAGKLLVDKQTSDDVTNTIANAKQISAKADNMVTDIQQKDLPKVDQTLTNVQQATGRLNDAVGTFLSPGPNQEPTAKVLRDTVQQVDQASGNLADDTEAIKHNFFLRGFFKRRGFYDLAHMTPAKYEDSEFIKKPLARVWIPAEGLFQIGPDGAQTLTSNAKAILDRATSGIVKDLPNNPVMVEGYSTMGTPEQRYVSSQQRAEDVRQFLLSTFHMKPKWVGTIAFEDQAPKRSGKETWDGASIVVIQSR